MSEYVTRREKVISSEPLIGGIMLERVHEHVEVKLKVCPHCGGKAEIKHDEQTGDYEVYIECAKCGIASKLCEMHEEAAELWNRRVPPTLWGNTKLKNCAFCGGAAKVNEVDNELSDDPSDEIHIVECEECGAHTRARKQVRTAIKDWDRRCE